MGFNVANLNTRNPRQGLKCANLIDYIAQQGLMGYLHIAPAKAHQITIPHMRTCHDTLGLYLTQNRQKPLGIARVKTAGDVGTADHLQHRPVIAHGPGTESFTQITVQINSHLAPAADRLIIG
jgi:hypothetical protein